MREALLMRGVSNAALATNIDGLSNVHPKLEFQKLGKQLDLIQKLHITRQFSLSAKFDLDHPVNHEVMMMDLLARQEANRTLQQRVTLFHVLWQNARPVLHYDSDSTHHGFNDVRMNFSYAKTVRGMHRAVLNCCHSFAEVEIANNDVQTVFDKLAPLKRVNKLVNYLDRGVSYDESWQIIPDIALMFQAVGVSIEPGCFVFKDEMGDRIFNDPDSHHSASRLHRELHRAALSRNADKILTPDGPQFNTLWVRLAPFNGSYPLRTNITNGGLLSQTPYGRALIVPVTAPPARICALVLAHQLQVSDDQLIVYNLNEPNKLAGKIGNELPFSDCQSIFEPGKVHLVYRLGLTGFKFHYTSVVQKFGRHLPSHCMVKPSLSNFTAYPNGCIYRVETQLSQRVVSRALYQPHIRDTKCKLWQGYLGLSTVSPIFDYQALHNDTEMLSVPHNFQASNPVIVNSPACEFLGALTLNAMRQTWKLCVPCLFRPAHFPTNPTAAEDTTDLLQLDPYIAYTKANFFPHNYPEGKDSEPEKEKQPDAIRDLLHRSLYDELDDLPINFLNEETEILQPVTFDWWKESEEELKDGREENDFCATRFSDANISRKPN